ncbi:uncharacterized protein C12orf56 homolog [Nycticebus coucang]|uniref:uncharacterized protein C12orf56 homolog n=1 Tax=Nycticebus coucang TaxID=9470 RepID=UPI00234DA65E|nr:uncharacterized protein C12orf56 homolog [Nycticebus coucang]
MAGPARPGFPARTNGRLDAFLRRHLPPEVYDAVRAYEPCIVVSDSENHTFKYVVLSDRLIYLTENPPKSIQRVVALRDVVAIDLIDDYPEFLSSPVREINQHIRIIFSSTVLKKDCEKSKGVRKFLFPFRYAKAKKKVKEENNGPALWTGKEPRNLKESSLRYHPESGTPSKDSAVCPSDLRELTRPLPNPSRRSHHCIPATSQAVSEPSCPTNTKEPQGLPDYKDSLSEIPFKCSQSRNNFYFGNPPRPSPLQSDSHLQRKESELHLYVISTTSSIFLLLKSSWKNYILKATLLQDPLYASEFSPAAGRQKPYRSEEKIKHFSQLKSELFLKDNTLKKILHLITELKVAAQKNFILKRLFWKTSDLFSFLVNKLREYLPESRDRNALQSQGQRADELVACIEIIQTLGLMFRETETESSRLNTLAAKKETLFNLLVILISEPQIPKSYPVFDMQLVADSTLVEMSFDAKLQKLILEYSDTATALVYEILLVSQQGNLGLGSTEFATSWVMSFLQSCPPTITFVTSIVRKVVKGLSAPAQWLSPRQAVLLYQQLSILRSCLQHSGTLGEHIRTDHREEFRYFIHMPALEERLPSCYPITQSTTQLFREVLKLAASAEKWRPGSGLVTAQLRGWHVSSWLKPVAFVELMTGRLPPASVQSHQSDPCGLLRVVGERGQKPTLPPRQCSQAISSEPTADPLPARDLTITQEVALGPRASQRGGARRKGSRGTPELRLPGGLAASVSRSRIPGGDVLSQSARGSSRQLATVTCSDTSLQSRAESNGSTQKHLIPWSKSYDETDQGPGYDRERHPGHYFHLPAGTLRPWRARPDCAAGIESGTRDVAALRPEPPGSARRARRPRRTDVRHP